MGEDQFIDPVTLKILNITKDEAEKDGYKVKPMTLEDSYEVNKGAMGNPDPKTYQMFYEDIMSKELYDANEEYMSRASGNKTTTTETENIIKYDPRSKWLINPEVLGYDNKSIPYKIFESHNVNGRIGQYYDRHGNIQYSFTTEQQAEINNKYYKQDGSIGNLSDYKKMDFNGNPFRIDENGNEKMLVLDPSSRSWVEADSDAVVESNRLRSMYGPKKAESGIFENMGVQSWNTIVDETYGAAGTVSEMMGTFGGWITGQKDANSWQKWGRRMQNYAGISKSKVSEAVENEGAFGSWRAGLGTAANAITQVASQALVGLATRGIGNLITVPFKGISGALKLSKYTTKLMNAAPWTFGAAYAAQAMNDEAKAAGLDDKSRAMMSLLAMGAVYGSEYALKAAGAAGIVDMFADNALAKQLDDAVRSNYRSVLGEVKDAVNKGMTGKAATEFMEKKVNEATAKAHASLGIDLTQKTKGTGMLANIKKGIANWNYSDKPGSIWARTMAGFSSGVEEGAEEVIEGGINALTKTIYNNYWADPNAKPGQGKFQNTAWEDPISEFMAGTIGGGLMGFVIGGKKKVNINKNYSIAELALNMDEKDGMNFLADLHKKGMLDNPLLDANDQFIQSLPKDQQDKAMSLNDIAHNSLKEQLKEAHKIIQMTGLKDSEKISKLMGGDMKLAKDALANMLYLKTANLELSQMQAQLKEMKEGSAEHNELSKQILEQQSVIQQKEGLVKDILDGSAVEKYRALNLIRTFNAKRKAGNNLTQEEISEAFGKSIAELETEDDWTNEEKAYRRVSAARELNQKFEELNKNYDANRKKSQELFDLISKYNFDDLDIKSVQDILNDMDAHFKTPGGVALRSQFGEIFGKMDGAVEAERKKMQRKFFDNDKVKKEVKQRYDEIIADEGLDETKLTDKQKQEINDRAEQEISGDIDMYTGTDIKDLFDTVQAEIQQQIGGISQTIKDKEQSNLIDDRDLILAKGLKTRSLAKGAIEISTYLADYVKDENEGRTKKQYTVTDNKTKKSVNISQKEYEDRKTDAKSNTDSFVHNDKTYNVETVDAAPGTFRTFKQKFKQVDKNGNPIETEGDVIGIDTKAPARELIADKDNDFTDEIDDLWFEIDADNFSPELVKQAEDLQQRIKERFDDIQLALEFAINNQYLPESVKKWIAISGTEQSINALQALSLNVESQINWMDHTMSILKQNIDIREKLFEDYRVAGFKQMATVSNKLSNTFKDKKVVVDGVELQRPPSFDINNLDESTVLKAIQYWHHYVNQADDADFKESFNVFWNSEVLQLKKDADGNYTDDAKTGANVYSNTKSSEQGMFVEDFDAYIKNLESSDYFANNEDGDTYRIHAYYNWMNIIFNLDVNNYYKAFYELIENDNSYPRGAHTSEQMMVMMQAAAHMHENQNIQLATVTGNKSWLDKHDYYKNMMKVGTPTTGAWGLYSKVLDPNTNKVIQNGNHIQDNVMLISAPGGAGKTSYIVRTLLEYASDVIKKRGNIVLVVRNENQLKELKASALDAGLLEGKDFNAMLVTDFIEKQHEYKDNLIIIDEVSLLTPQEKNAMYFQNTYSEYNGNKIIPANRKDGTPAGKIDKSNTIFFLGDEYQPPYDPVEGSKEMKFSEYVQHTITITQVKRTSFKDIFGLQNIFRRETAKQGKARIPVIERTFSYFSKDNERKGVRLEDNEDAFFEEAKRVNSVDNAFLVVLTNADKVKAESKGINSDKIKVMTDINNTPQGMTIDEVYVYVPTSYFSDKNEKDAAGNYTKIKNDVFMKYMGMAVGRGKDFVMMYSNGYTHKGSTAVNDISGLDIFQQTKVLEKKQELKTKVDSHVKGTYQTKPQNYAAKKSSKGLPDLTPEEKENAYQAETNKYSVGGKVGSHTVTSAPTKVSENEAEFTAENDKETVVYKIGFDGGTNKWSTTIKSRIAKPKRGGRKKPYSKKTLKKELDRTIFKLNKDVNLKTNTGRTIKGTVSDITDVDNPDGSITRTITLFNDGYEDSTIVLTINAFDKSINQDSIKIGEKLADDESNDDSDGTTPEDNVNEDMVIEQNIDDSINRVVYTDKTGNVHFFVTGATYPIRMTGKVDNTYVKIKLVKDPNTGEVKVKYFDTRTGTVVSLDDFIANKLAAETTGRKDRELLSEEEFWNRAMSDLYTKRELYFTGDYFPLFGSETVADENTRLELFKQRMLEAQNAINQAANSKSFAYRVVLKKSTGVQFQNSSGDASSPSSYFVVEYMYKKPDGTKEYVPVSYIALYDDSSNAYYKELQARAEKIFSENNGKNEIVITENDTNGINAFVPGSILNTKKGTGRMSSADLINEMAEKGFLLDRVEQVKERGKTSTYAYFKNGNIQERVMIESKQLLDNPAEAAKYIEDLIDELNNATSDDAIKDLLSNTGNVGFFHEYNKSQLRSDYLNSVPWVQELAKATDKRKEILIPVNAETPGADVDKMRVAGDINDPQAFKKNMLVFLGALKDNLSGQNIPTRLRFAPSFDKANRTFKISDFYTAFNQEVKQPAVIIPLVRKQDALLRAELSELEQVEYDASLEQVAAEFDELIGPARGLEFVEGMLGNENAHGKITAFGKIVLNMQNGTVSRRTMYHEVAHYVAEFLLKENERKMLYEEAARKRGLKNFDYYNLSQRRQVAEYFAEAAERYAYDRRNMKGLTKLFTQFLDYIKYVLDRFGLLSDITHRYLYDIYVNKKYKSQEGTTSEQITEMPYTELYKSEGFKEFTLVEKHFDDSAIARDASRRLGEYTANQILRPNLNSRLFKDADLPFKDIVNRVENSLRMTAMYQTDENGYIEVHTDGEFKGMPILLTDANGEGLMVEHNNEYVELFKYEKNPVDEEGVKHIGVRLTYFSKKDNKYIVAVPNSKGILFSDSRTKKYIRASIKEAMKGFMVETFTKDENGENKKIPAFPTEKEQKQLAKKVGNMPNYKNFMYAVALMDDNIFAAAMNRYLPGINITELLDAKRRQITTSEAMLKLMEQLDSITRENTESVNPMDRLSDLVKFVIRTTPRYYTGINIALSTELNNISDLQERVDFINDNNLNVIKNNDGTYSVLSTVEVHDSHPQGKYFNHEEVSKIMFSTMMNAGNNFTDSVTRFSEAIKNRIDEKIGTYGGVIAKAFLDNEFNILMSMYKEHFSLEKGDISNARIMSWHLEYVKNPERLTEFYNEYLNGLNAQKQNGLIENTEPALTLQEFEKGLETRSFHASKIVTSLVTSFGSINTDSYAKIVVYGDRKMPKASVRRMGSESSDQKKMDLERHLYGTMLTAAKSVTEGYVNLLGLDGGQPKSPDGKRNPFTIFAEDGIYYKPSNQQAVKIFNINPDTNTIESVPYGMLSGIDLEKALKSMLGEVFDKDFSYRFVKRLATPVAPGYEKEAGWNQMGQILGPMFLATYSFASNRYYGSEAKDKMILLESYENILANFKAGSPNYGKVTEEAYGAMSNTEATEDTEALSSKVESTDLYHPAGYYEELQKLGDILAVTDGGFMTPYFRGIGNKKIYRDTTQDSIGYNLADGGKNYAQNYASLATGGAINGNFNHIVRRNVFGENVVEFLNPFVSGNNQINPATGEIIVTKGFVNEFAFMNGIQSSSRQTEFKNLAGINLYDQQIMHFAPSADVSEASFPMRKFYVELYNQGDRSRQRMFSLDWRMNGYLGKVQGVSDGILTMKKTDKKTSYGLDADNIFKHVVNIFRSTEKIAHNSLVRWGNLALDIAGQDQISIDGESVLSRQDIEQLDLTDPNYTAKRDAIRTNIIKVVNQLNALGRFSITDNNQIVEFDGTDMRSGIDYIITTSNGQKSVRLGHGTTMNADVYSKGEERKENPEKVFNNTNFYTKRRIRIDKNTVVYASIEELSRSMDENGDFYVTTKPLKKGLRPVKTETYKVPAAAKEKILYKVFGKQLADTNQKAIKSGYSMSKEYLASIGHEVKSEYKDGIKISPYKYATVWAANEMAHKIFNMYFAYAFEGSLSQEMDNNINFDSDKSIQWSANNNKRSVMHSSTFTKPTFDGYYGLDTEGEMLYVSSIVMPAFIDGFTSLETNKHKAYDGQSFKAKLSAVMEHNASGEMFNNINKEGMAKTVGISQNLSTGESEKLKHAEHIASFQSMEYMPAERLMQEMLHNPYARKIVEGTNAIINNPLIRTNTIPENQDSIWQRYLIYEVESKYVNAIQSMENIIDRKGGLREYVSSIYKNKIKNPDDIDRIVTDIENTNKKGIPNFVYYQELAQLMTIAGDVDYIEEPSDYVSYEWAWDKTAKFYYEKRAEGKTGIGKDYRFIRGIAQRDDSIKQKSQTQTLPLNFGAIGATQAGSTVDVRQLNFLATPSGMVPNDVFETYLMWKQEDADLPVDKFARRFNNTGMGFQLNANRNVDDASESPMIQLMSIILASPEQHDNGDSDKMMKIIAGNIRLALERFQQDEQRYVNKKSNDRESILSSSELKLINQFVKEKVKMSMKSIDDTSMLSVIIGNESIDISVSQGAEERVFQYLSAFIRKEAIKRKQTSMRLVQAAGNHAELYRYTHQDGSVEAFSYNGAIKYIERISGIKAPETESKKVKDEWLIANGFTKDTLKHTTIKLGKEVPKDIQDMLNASTQGMTAKDKSQFITRYYIENGYAVVEKGEALVPAAKFDKYDIPKHTTFNELFRLMTIENGKYTDTRLLDLASNGKENRAEIANTIRNAAVGNLLFNYIPGINKEYFVKATYGEGMKKGDNSYFDHLFLNFANAWIKGNGKAFGNIVKQAKVNIASAVDNFDAAYIKDGKLSEKYYSDMSAEISKLVMQDKDFAEMLEENVQKYTSGLIANALAVKDAVGVRTPSGPGSGFYVNVVGFVNDNGSTGYVNTIKNLIDGSDQDIDQFNFYFKDDTLQDLGYNESEILDIFNKRKKENEDNLNESDYVNKKHFDELVNRNNNALMDLVFKFYANPKNNVFTGSAINMDAINKVANDNIEKLMPNGDVIHGIGMSILYRRASFEGQSTVGNFARGQKGTTHIAKAFWSNNSHEKLFNTKKFPGLRNYTKEIYREKPAQIESFVNSSTDNIKEQSLGKMNINVGNATFVSTSVVNGNEIVDFVRNNPERFGMTKEYVSTLNSDRSFFIGNDEILNRFFVGQAFEDITNFISKQDDALGYGFQDRLFKSAHTYFSYLTKNNTKANERINDAVNNITRTDIEIKSRLEMFGLKLEDFNNDFSIKNIERVLRTKSSPKYKAIQLALQKEIEKTLGEEDTDVSENLDDFIYTGLKNSNLYDKLLEEGKSSAEIEQYIAEIQKEYDAIKENVYNIIKNFKYRYVQENYIKTEGKKADINYQREVYLIAKYAMLSEWQDGMTRIIDINQFKITSPYEALKYLDNVQMMTGRSPRALVDLYEKFRTEKEKNPSLTAYDYLQANAKVTPEEMFDNYENMNKHAIARERNENRNHINESLDYDDGTIKETINFKEDFFAIADNSALLLAMDSIMESIKAVIHLDDLRKKVFATHNDVFTAAMNDMMERAGFDKYNEVTFRKFHEATHDYITSDFISRSDKMLSTYNNAIKNINGVDYSGKAFVGVSFTDGASIGRIPQFLNASSRKDFIMQFPVLFNDVIKKQLMNEIQESGGLYRGSKYATELIQRLEVKRQGGMQYIELINQLTQTSEDEANMRQGFVDLDQNIADLLSIYQIVKSGFEYQKGFLAKVMPSRFYEIYSEYLTNLKETQGLNIPQEQIEDFKKQLLYNPDNEFLQYERRVRTVVDGKERWLPVPPLAAYGQAKEYIKTAYSARKNRFGRTVIKAVAQTQQSDFIGSASSSTKTGNDKVIPSTRILDIHNTKVPVSKTSYFHSPSGLLLNTSNMSMSKYLKYFIKGGFESKYDELVKQKTKENKLEVPSPEILYASANEAFAWVNEQRDNPSESTSKERIRINKLDNPDKSFADAFGEAQDEWYKLVAEKLRETFDENTFAQVYNSLKGGVITSPNMSNAFGSASALSAIFNATRGNYNALSQIQGFASTQDLIIEPVTKMFINRLTSIGHNYDRYISDETIVELKTTKADKFYGALFNKKESEVYNERFNNDRRMFSTFVSDVVYTTMLGEKQAIATLYNPEYQSYINAIRAKFGNISDTDIIRLINDNANQWVERNSDLRNTMERRQKKIEMNNAGENPNKNAHWLELSRTGDSIAKIGDVIYFDIEHRGVVTSLENPYYDDNMNIRGYKTIRYVLDPNYSPGKDKTMKAVFSLDAHVAKNNSIRTLQSAVEVFAKSMPNVPYEYITNEQASEMGESGSASFYKNGVVYINVDKADQAVALHEFAHPFIIALQTENKPLFDRLAEQVMNNTEVMNFVKNNYPELDTDEQMLMEAIPTYLQMRMYKRMWLEQSAEERAEWQEYFAWLNNTFSYAMSNGEVSTENLSMLDFENATLNQIADAILNDFTGGKVLSMTKPAKHAIPYTMKASSSSKLKNINISNIDRLFQNKGEQSKEEEARIFINSGINAAIASGSVYTGVSNSYNFSASNPAFKQDGLFSQQKFEQYKEEVVKNEMSFYVGMDNKMLMFFDQLKLADKTALTAATGTIFMSWDKLYKTAEMTDAELEALNQKVEKMLIHIGYDYRTDKAFTLQDAVTELGITMPTNIVGNPIVIIHNRNTPSQSISILDITTLGLKSHGVGDMATLGDAFVDSEELTRKDRATIRQVKLMNTNQDINALKNAIIAMAFKKSNPDLKFKKVGSVRITGKDYQPHFMYMEDMVVHAKQLFSIDYFKNSLERDLFELVSDEALLDPNAYKIDVMDKLKDYVETKLAQSEDIKDKEKLQSLKDTIVAVEADHMQAQMKTLAGAIRARLTYLRNQVFGNDSQKIALSDEYYELASMYMDLTAYNDINVAKVTPIDFDEKWLKTVDRWHGKVRTWVFDSLDTAMRKSKELIMPFQEEMQEEVSKLNQANPHINIFTDASHKLFDKVIKKRKIKDAKTGEMVDISMHELHWDENDAETAKALRDGDLTMAELNFGKWLSNKMYEEFVEYVIEVERSSIAKGNDTPEQLRAAAEMVVSSRYRRGMMPVFSKSFSSALSEGKIMEAYNLFTESAGKWYGGNIYVDYQQSDNPDEDLQEGSFHKLLSPFWNQFTSVSMNGSQSRMNMLGVGYENGELVLLNKDRNNSISMNLQNVGLFTKAASTRARTMREAVANVNIALDILRAEEKQKGVKTDDIIEQIENYVNRQVYGNLPKTGVMQTMSAVLNLDSAFDASGKLIYMIHLAVNPVLGAKNAVSAATKGFISSLANAMSGSKMFTPADVVKAISEVVANPAKVEKINRKYQLVNITERDLLNHWTNNQTRKNVMETDFQMLFHWFGDHYTQLIGSVAQMINDGTYDAHDENGNYDPDKDKRFEGEDGKLIKEDILRRQTLEGYHVPDGNKMTHAYTQRDENRIKVINQRYVGELNDNQYKNMISSFGIARAVMVLRNYMYNVKQFWWSNRRPDVMIGGRKVVDEKVVWEPVMAEGVLNTIVYMIGQVRSGEKIEMDSFRKRNVYAAGASLLVLGSLYFVLDVLTEGFDDDDEEGVETPYYKRITGILFGEKGYNIKKDQKEINYAQQMLRYILGGGANENLSYLNPLKTFYDAKNQPNALFLQSQNIIDAFVGTLTLPFEVSGLDNDPILTDIDEYAYSLSKIAPYGSNYRLIRNAIEQILIDINSDKDFLSSIEANNY